MPRFESLHSGGIASAEEWTAGRAVACGTQVIVPVMRIGAQVAGASPSPGSSITWEPGVGGSGFAEFVAAWVRGEDGRVQWLPREPSPPKGAADWPQWLAQQPELKAQIEDAARRLEPRS